MFYEKKILIIINQFYWFLDYTYMSHENMRANFLSQQYFKIFLN